MSKLTPRDRARIADLDRLYATLPRVACQRRCFIACGTVPLTDLEARRLRAVTGRKPKTLPVVQDGRTIQRCLYLSARHACTVYDQRPLMCRLWGVVKALSCPHGCVPDRWLTDREFVAIGAAVERLGGAALETSATGLVPIRLSFTELDATAALPQARSDAAMDAGAERTRSLRAIFGGRILGVIEHER